MSVHVKLYAYMTVISENMTKKLENDEKNDIFFTPKFLIKLKNMFHMI